MDQRITLPASLLVGCTAGFFLGRGSASSPAPPAPPAPAADSDLVEAGASSSPDRQTWIVPGDAPTALRPLAPASPAEAALLSLVYDWVYYRDADGHWQSRVIEDWAREGDQVLLTLRDDLQWHDGQPVTALDLCTSLSARALHSPLPAPSRCFRRDDLHAEVDIPDLGADWRLALAAPLLPAHIDGIDGATPIDAHRDPVGSGPYRARVGRRGLRFEAAPSAHHAPRLARIDVQGGGDPVVSVFTLTGGHADVLLGAPAAWQDRLDDAGAALSDGHALGRIAWADATDATSLSPDAAFADVVERPDGT
ncbi:MAG: hypothetical protein H6742_12610 [Alphaproteobacteria bacterium]|nr:hypothetical protein [Alphaproteobacteria bacterium]